MTVNPHLDIRPMWANLARRIQQTARAHEGYAIVQITALVNSSGDPIFYREPKIVRIEPKRTDVTFLMQELDDDQLNTLLKVMTS